MVYNLKASGKLMKKLTINRKGANEQVGLEANLKSHYWVVKFKRRRREETLNPQL